MDRIPITPQGKEAMRAELERFRLERTKNIQDIETARAHGDISENAEYAAAKEQQSHIEGRIRDLESKLARVDVIDPKTLSHDRIVFGATVCVVDCTSNEEWRYQIVGDFESDIKNYKISINSPIARALIGKQEGDLVKVKAPGGIRELEIVSIAYG